MPSERIDQPGSLLAGTLGDHVRFLGTVGSGLCVVGSLAGSFLGVGGGLGEFGGAAFHVRQFRTGVVA